MHHPGQKCERAIGERLHNTDQIFLEGDSLSYPFFFTESIKTAGRKSLSFDFPPCFLDLYKAQLNPSVSESSLII